CIVRDRFADGSAVEIFRGNHGAQILQGQEQLAQFLFAAAGVRIDQQQRPAVSLFHHFPPESALANDAAKVVPDTTKETSPARSCPLPGKPLFGGPTET